MVAYADLILPDTTYLERWDCISLLDRPISERRRRRPTRSASRWSSPTATCGRSRTCCSISARGSAAGLRQRRRRAALSRRLSRLHRQPRAQPGIGPLAGWRGADGEQLRQGRAQPEPARALHRQRLLLASTTSRRSSATTSTPTAPISTGRRRMGFIADAEPIVFQLYLEPLQKIPPRRARATARCSRREQHRERIATYFDPLPFWYPPFEAAASTASDFPLHADHPAADAHVPLVGLAERLAAPDHGARTASTCIARPRASARHRRRRLGLDRRARIGRVKGQVKLMDGVNPDTVWTWNAIGKRARRLARSTHDAPEATRGFLLNHLISELLPEREGGYRFSNTDPVTGQAAWYDLRVRIEKADDAGVTEPQFERCSPPVRAAARAASCADSRGRVMTSLPDSHRPRSSAW